MGGRSVSAVESFMRLGSRHTDTLGEDENSGGLKTRGGSNIREADRFLRVDPISVIYDTLLETGKSDHPQPQPPQVARLKFSRQR